MCGVLDVLHVLEILHYKVLQDVCHFLHIMTGIRSFFYESDIILLFPRLLILRVVFGWSNYGHLNCSKQVPGFNLTLITCQKQDLGPQF